MLAIAVGAVATLVGILLGGALRAWETSSARKMEADSTLSAIVAEIEAITRLINHRQFIPSLMETQSKAQIQIAANRGDENAEFLVISLKNNYFLTYETLIHEIGMLHPYWADRITRLYTFLKAVTENYHPDSPFQSGQSALTTNAIIANDLMLLHTVVLLGNHISAEARKIMPPAGVQNSFTVENANGGQPQLPISQPSLASREASKTNFTE